MKKPALLLTYLGLALGLGLAAMMPPRVSAQKTPVEGVPYYLNNGDFYCLLGTCVGTCCYVG